MKGEIFKVSQIPSRLKFLADLPSKAQHARVELSTKLQPCGICNHRNPVPAHSLNAHVEFGITFFVERPGLCAIRTY